MVRDFGRVGLAWVLGAMMGLTGCGGDEPGDTGDTVDHIPDHPMAGRWPDGRVPWQAREGVETDRRVRPLSLLAAAAAMEGDELAVVFPPADREGLDLALAGLDHPWSREPLMDTPLDQVGDVAAVGDRQGRVWVLVRERGEPQRLTLIRRDGDGTVVREEVERPDGPSHPFEDDADRCPDLAINVSPDGFLDLAFRQVSAQGRFSVHHLRRPLDGGSWQARVAARDDDERIQRIFVEGEPAEVGCHSLLGYDESGWPELITTVEHVGSGRDTIGRLGLFVGTDQQWRPSRPVHLADGRSQWAGPHHGGSMMSMELMKLPMGLPAVGPDQTSDPERADRTRLTLNLHAMQVDTRPRVPDEDYPAYRREDFWYRTYDEALLAPFGDAARMIGGIYMHIAAKADRWEGVYEESFSQAAGFRPAYAAPVWQPDVEARSPVFTRGPAGWFAGVCVDRERHLVVCAGGRQAHALQPVDEPLQVVETSIDADGRQPPGEGVRIRFDRPADEIDSLRFNLTDVVEGEGDSEAGVELTAQRSSDGSFVVGGGFQPYKTYRLRLIEAFDEQGNSLVGPMWQYPYGKRPYLDFWVPGEHGRFRYADPRETAYRMPCEELGFVRDADGVCSYLEPVIPDAMSEFAQGRVLLLLNFDPDTAEGAMPWLIDPDGARVDTIVVEPRETHLWYDPWRDRNWDHIRFTEPLEEGVEYTLVYPDGIHDGMGTPIHPDDMRIRFRTAASALRLLSTIPEDGATEVDPAAPLVVEFNLDIELASLQEGARLVPEGGPSSQPVWMEGSPVALTGARSGPSTYTLNHARLEADTRYRLTLDASVRSFEVVGGDQYLEGAPREITFRTRASQ
ncbi:MAG: Ig-like domain-containing protein [Deltaproteobacteria bacterium]|nr:Ig-like domain-containing protein [Deltaproteobacteria bacterium]MCB9788651.1 Ig-like domain-containing protein [Deltaproteobacteria bacterium]